LEVPGGPFVDNPRVPTKPSTGLGKEISMRAFGLMIVSTNPPRQLLLQDLSIIRRRSKNGDSTGRGFLSFGLFSLEAGRGMPYYGDSILELTNTRAIRSTPHQEVAV
jgi:hypothetical protein